MTYGKFGIGEWVNRFVSDSKGTDKQAEQAEVIIRISFNFATHLKSSTPARPEDLRSGWWDTRVFSVELCQMRRQAIQQSQLQASFPAEAKSH